MTRFTPIRGGTVTLRDPAMLNLLNTPFDPFAHVADVKPPAWGNIRYNLPNLAIFLWRLEDYRVQAAKPVWRAPDTNPIVEPDTGDPILDPDTDEEIYVARFDIHPLGHPLRLFNTYQFEPDRQPPIVTELDETPGPIPTARLTQGSEAGQPEKYVSIDTYDPGEPAIASRTLAEVGLQLHLPTGITWPAEWTFRGANLCAWENGLPSTIKTGEIVIDPVIGRLLFGVASPEAAEALQNNLLVTYTYGAVGPVGVHPISRDDAPEQWHGEAVDKREVNFHTNPNGLQESLDDIQDCSVPIVIEIQDSMTHTLDLGAVLGRIEELEGSTTVPSLQLNRSLIIRAAGNQRPIIQLNQPLRFRPTHVAGTTPEEQNQFNAVMDYLTVRLEGLYINRSETFPVGEPLIARTALNKLEIINCTLDPGGYQQLDGTPDGTRAPTYPALQLHEPYGFANFDEENAFDQTPEIVIQHTITGPLRIDRGYKLSLQDSIIDAGKTEFAVAGTDAPTDDLVGGWGPPTQVNGITVFGRMRVESLHGRGGIWVHRLEVLNDQRGCIKFSYFSGQGDRLPQNHACVKGTEARLRFTSDLFEHPAYGQLTHTTDFRIRERGPRDDAMGAFGFLLEAHKWRNLQIRYREFMPVGIRPLLIPVT